MRSMNVSLSDNPVYLRTSKVCLAKVCLASGGDLGGQRQPLALFLSEPPPLGAETRVGDTLSWSERAPNPSSA